MQQIRGPINGNARVYVYANRVEMFGALLDKKVDALLYAAPVLRYYAAREGKGLVRMVGPEFNKEGLGIAFPNGSPLRRQVNNALIAMREDGTYQRIYEKWFGSEVQTSNE